MKAIGKIIKRALGLGLVAFIILFVTQVNISATKREAHKAKIISEGATIGARRFYVGQSAIASRVESISLRSIGFLDDLFKTDPVLSGDYRLSFIEQGVMSVGARVMAWENGSLLPGVPVTLSDDMVDGYLVFQSGPMKTDSVSLYPDTPDPTYYLQCYRTDIGDGYWSCRLYAEYPKDRAITLFESFNIYGKLQDASSDFLSIVTRLGEIATCLDMTDQPFPQSEQAFLAAHPKMSGCE